jgi:L-2-amino-thiazoline-4-carboxylic acid hydrolase
MDDLNKEREEGLDWEYLWEVPQRKEEVGDTYQTPGFGLAGQLFACVAKAVIERLGREEGEALLREGIELFGRERGRHIAERVRAMDKPLTIKNWLIFTDIDSGNFGATPNVEDGDLLLDVDACTFHAAAAEWGLADYACIYCRYADHAILGGYNPDIRLTLEPRDPGGGHCFFRYRIKEGEA